MMTIADNNIAKAVKIYYWMLDLDMTLMELMVYAYVYGFTSNSQVCDSTNLEIAQFFPFAEKSVSRAISHLEKKGWVKRINHRRRRYLVALDKRGEVAS